MLQLILIISLLIFHSLSLWNSHDFVAGGNGDSLAHAAIPEWFCKKVVHLVFNFTDFMAPFGVNLSNNYDSPFPFILTCPFTDAGSIFQFNLFAIIQLTLVVFSSLYLAKKVFKQTEIQTLYVLFVWFSGFYLLRSKEHITLFSVIWGAQFLIAALMSIDFNSKKSVLINACLLGLSLIGTFQNIPLLVPVMLAFLVYNYKKLTAFSIFAGGAIVCSLFLVFWFPTILSNLNAQNPAYIHFSRYASEATDLLGFTFPVRDHYLNRYFPSLPKLPFEQSAQFDILISLLFIFAIYKKSLRQLKYYNFFIGVILFYLFISTGRVLHLAGEELFRNPLNDFILNLYPFNLSRIPARNAAFAGYFMIFSVFCYLDALELNKIKKRALHSFLFVWIILTGPIANNLIYFPTFEYTKYLPMKALNLIKNDPTPGLIVVHIPNTWMGEPNKNFLWLFHQKPISSAYLAYPLYTKELEAQFSKDPFLGNIGCGDNLLSFKNNSFMNDDAALKAYLVKNNLTYFITDKLVFDLDPSCDKLKVWLLGIFNKPWIQIHQETSRYVIYGIK